MKTLIAQALNIPQNELETTLKSGFYVKINKHYTATVRDLASFVDYLQGNPNEPDENFGIIVKEARVPIATPIAGINGLECEVIEDSKFYENLLNIIAYVKDFAVFNLNPHQFVELTNSKETVSIRTKGGKLVTIAFMEDADCADIQVHNSGLEPVQNGRPIPQFEIVGFNCGSTPVKKTLVTLNTIHLGKKISS
jgi:hypothetical protein